MQIFAALPRDITLFDSPHCDDPHLLAGVQARLGELQLHHEYAATATWHRVLVAYDETIQSLRFRTWD